MKDGRRTGCIWRGGTFWCVLLCPARRETAAVRIKDRREPMKNIALNRAAVGVLACGMVFGLTACGSASSSSSEDVDASSAESADSAGEEVSEESYDYLANFTFSDAFDENGYLIGVTASDYVTLPDLSELSLSDEANEVSDEDIDSYISDDILASYVTSEQITDREAEDGDTVNIDFSGSIDGTAFDGGTSTGYDLVLGSGTFIDNFEEQIIGHTPGETFDVVVTFPEDYGSDELNGKEAVFTTTLNYISESVVPELNDDWVYSNLYESNGLEDVDSLYSYVENTLLFNQCANELYAELYESVTVEGELPDSVNEYFTNYYLYQPYLYAQAYGMTVSDIVAQSGYESVDDYLTSIESSKESMIKQILIMQALAEQKELVCDTDTLYDQFSNYFGTADISSYIDAYGENYVKTNVLHDLAMQSLIDEINA